LHCDLSTIGAIFAENSMICMEMQAIPAQEFKSVRH